jgi:hypothetical protein
MRSKRQSEGMYDEEIPIKGKKDEEIDNLELKEYQKIVTVQDTLKGMSGLEHSMLEFIKTSFELTKAFSIHLALKLDLFKILKDKSLNIEVIISKANIKIPIRQFMALLDKISGS